MFRYSQDFIPTHSKLKNCECKKAFIKETIISSVCRGPRKIKMIFALGYAAISRARSGVLLTVLWHSLDCHETISVQRTPLDQPQAVAADRLRFPLFFFKFLFVPRISIPDPFSSKILRYPTKPRNCLMNLTAHAVRWYCLKGRQKHCSGSRRDYSFHFLSATTRYRPLSLENSYFFLVLFLPQNGKHSHGTLNEFYVHGRDTRIVL